MAKSEQVRTGHIGGKRVHASPSGQGWMGSLLSLRLVVGRGSWPLLWGHPNPQPLDNGSWPTLWREVVDQFFFSEWPPGSEGSKKNLGRPESIDFETFLAKWSKSRVGSGWLVFFGNWLTGFLKIDLLVLWWCDFWIYFENLTRLSLLIPMAYFHQLLFSELSAKFSKNDFG